MNFEQTGSNESLFWITACLSICGGQLGVFVLDTGSGSLVTKLKQTKQDGGQASVRYGSGTVNGYKGRCLISLGGNISYKSDIIHSVPKIPHTDDVGGRVDGILGLLPTPGKDNAITSVQFDFLQGKLHLNHTPIYAPTIRQNVAHHDYPNKLWLFGDIKLYSDTRVCLLAAKNKYFMLDTGSTVAVTFFGKKMATLLECDTKRKLHVVELTVQNTTLTQCVSVDTRWPACLPHDMNQIEYFMLGIQFLNTLHGLHYEITRNNTVGNVSLSA